jgi:hypothetical protein
MLRSRPCAIPIDSIDSLYPSIVSRDSLGGQRFSLGIPWIISQNFKSIRSISFQNGSIQSTCIIFRQARLIAVVGGPEQKIPQVAIYSARYSHGGCTSSLHPMGSSTMSRSRPSVRNGPMLAWSHGQGATLFQDVPSIGDPHLSRAFLCKAQEPVLRLSEPFFHSQSRRPSDDIAFPAERLTAEMGRKGSSGG